MPTLPDKTALGAPPSFDPNRPMALLRDGPDPGAMAMGLAGNALSRGAAAIKAKVQEADDYEVQKALVDFDLAQEKKLDDAKRTVGPEAKDFTTGYRASYDTDATNFMQRVPDRLKPKIDEILVKRGAAFEKRAYDFELRERDRFHIDDINKRLTDIYNDTAATPDRHDDNTQRGVALIRASKLPQIAKLKAEREFMERNQEFAVRARVDKYLAEGRDVGEIIDDLRKSPRGSWRQDAITGTGTAPSTIEFIKKLEGNKDNGWDVRQYSGPYGVRRGPNERLTLEQAEQRLKEEVAGVEKTLDRLIKAPLSESQRTALISLFYNIGTDKGRPEQVAKLINEGRMGEVPDWIRQFNRDRDGRQLRGLVTRRSQEADLFASGGAPRDGTAPVAPVERKDLPPPGDAVSLPEAGGGAVQKPTDTAEPDAPYEHETSPYAHLSPAARRKLINVIRTAGRGQVESVVASDIERLRLGQAPKVGTDGLTSLDRAKRFMTPIQFKVLQEKWTEAQMEHDVIAPLRGMPREQMYDHSLRRFADAEKSEDSLRAARRVQQKADREIEKILKLRDSDPVRSVNGFSGDDADPRRPPLRHTAEAMRILKQDRGGQDTVTQGDGTRLPVGPVGPRMTPQQQWELIFEARLKDQQEIMPDEPEKHRIIDRRQAERLLRMPKDGKSLDDATFRQRLAEAADRAEKQYGPKYAKRVMQEAIAFHLPGGNDEHKQVQANILRKMVQGEPIMADDVQRLRDLDSLSRSRIPLGIDSLATADRVGRGLDLPVAPMGNPGRPAIGQTFTPSQRQMDWLRENPDGWQAFDEKFGRGAAARILGSDDAWGSRRGDIPAARPGSPEARAADTAKPKEKSWWSR